MTNNIFLKSLHGNWEAIEIKSSCAISPFAIKKEKKKTKFKNQKI